MSLTSEQSFKLRVERGPPLRPGEEYKWEHKRLESFKNWPAWCSIGPLRLATAGFSYTGFSDEVLCFKCGGRLKGWNPGDEPIVEHRKYFPQCPFVLGNDVDNVPMFPSLSRQGLDVPDSGRFPTSSQVSSQFDIRNAMKDESARIQTFVNWPRDAPVGARDLAAAGFYYTGTADMVKCAYCGGMIRNFELGDTAMGEHKRHFPSCSFVKEYLNRQEQQNIRNIDEDDPIILDRPKHPQFATRQAREKTFERWPTDKTQKPDELVNAGFFYAKFNDNVKCFFCNGGLRNWEPGDNPWIEHARWFPKCGYVRQCKGSQFIRNIAEGKESEVLTHINNFPGQENKSAPAVPPPANPLEDALKKPYAQAVKELSFPEHMIRYAIKQKMDQDGTDFPNAPSLLDAIYQLEEDGIDTTEIKEVEGAAAAAVNTDPIQGPGEIGLERNLENLNLENRESDTEDPGLLNEVLDDEARQLLTENRKLKTQKICKVCKTNDVCVLLLPCAHLVSCEGCAGDLRECPVCGTGIRGTVKTYLV